MIGSVFVCRHRVLPSSHPGLRCETTLQCVCLFGNIPVLQRSISHAQVASCEKHLFKIRRMFRRGRPLALYPRVQVTNSERDKQRKETRHRRAHVRCSDWMKHDAKKTHASGSHCSLRGGLEQYSSNSWKRLLERRLTGAAHCHMDDVFSVREWSLSHRGCLFSLPWSYGEFVFLTLGCWNFWSRDVRSTSRA